MVVLLVGVFSSCEKKYTTENLSSMTYYPTFEMTGDAFNIVTLGESYTDPGVVASEDGQALDVTVTVSGFFNGYSGTVVNTDVADKYVITYSAENSDGYSGTTQRTVWVVGDGDLVNSIEGLYTSSVDRDGTPAYSGLEYVLIWKIGENTYGISDAAGGYYDIGRAYGYDYAAQGAVITANDIPSNDLTATTAIFPIWLNTIDMTNFNVDAANGQISFDGNADFGSVFSVTLTKVE